MCVSGPARTPAGVIFQAASLSHIANFTILRIFSFWAWVWTLSPRFSPQKSLQAFEKLMTDT